MKKWRAPPGEPKPNAKRLQAEDLSSNLGVGSAKPVRVFAGRKKKHLMVKLTRTRRLCLVSPKIFLTKDRFSILDEILHVSRKRLFEIPRSRWISPLKMQGTRREIRRL